MSDVVLERVEILEAVGGLLEQLDPVDLDRIIGAWIANPVRTRT